MNHDDQEFEADIWLSYFFYDPRLSWNIEDFPGVTALTVDPAMIWLPDFILKNSASGSVGVYDDMNHGRTDAKAIKSF